MKKLWLLAIIGFSYAAQAQKVFPSVINAAGGTYDNPASYFRCEWSFGELALINAFAPSDSSLLVTQGVMQPCIDKTDEPVMTFEKTDYSIFPNPTAGKFEINFFVKKAGRMRLQLVNAIGQVLEQRDNKYDGCCRVESFDLTRMPSGIYYIIAELTSDLAGNEITIIKRTGMKVVKVTQ